MSQKKKECFSEKLSNDLFSLALQKCDIPSSKSESKDSLQYARGSGLGALSTSVSFILCTVC